MAGTILTVCLPSGPGGDVLSSITSAMAPFEMHQGGNTECEMWDSWRIARGSEGIGFAILPGMERDGRLLHDDPFGGGTRSLSVPGVCVGGPRGILDLNGDHVVHERTAGAAWDFWESVSRSHAPAERLATYIAEYEAGDFDNLSEAISAYLKQEPIHRLMSSPFGAELGSMSVSNPQEHPVIGFDGGRDEYIREYAADWPVISDVLTLDGWWLEANGNRVHGGCDSAGQCSHLPQLPSQAPHDYLFDLPGDVTIIRLKCHS